MTGLLRTSLFFFLPVFIGLIAYQSWRASLPTPAEQREAFITQNQALVEKSRETAEAFIRNGQTGRHSLPEDLENSGIVVLEVTRDTGPVLTLVARRLGDGGNWSLQPAPKEGRSYEDINRFVIRSESQPSAIPVIFLEETVYGENGNPARLNLYLSAPSSPGDE